MSRTPLSNVDTAWLRMEDPTNLMMISGVMVFGTPLDHERLKATLQHGLLRFDRFRQRVVQPAIGRAYWQDDPEFDINYHLQRATLPPPGDQAALQDLASLLASTQLDLSRPLWQFHLVDNVAGGSALICRLHHCIGDGLALVHVLLSLTSTEPDEAWPAYVPGGKSRSRRSPLAKLTRPLRSAVKVSGQAGQAVLNQIGAVRADPAHATELVRLGTGSATALAKLVFRWPDPKTAFKGPLGVAKRAAWSAPIPLRDVKEVGKALGGTVNDVLLAAVSGGLRRYLLGHDQPVDGLNFRAVVPVNLRKPGTEHELGNKFGLVFLSLPVGIADPWQRLGEVRRRMDGLKGSLEAPVAFAILNGIGLTPQVIQDVVINIFGTKGTAVMTNVMGPPMPLYLAGAPLDSLMFWVPQSGKLGMGVSILSYAGRVWLGIITDEELVPDPEHIVAAFQAEFDGLLALARSIEAMSRSSEPLAQLDQALDSLDALLEDEGELTVVKGDGRCQALTQAGRRCKNSSLPGSAFCHIHQQ
jgi:WS/DGAT/MGAT family acyltransferase